MTDYSFWDRFDIEKEEEAVDSHVLQESYADNEGRDWSNVKMSITTACSTALKASEALQSKVTRTNLELVLVIVIPFSSCY